MPSDDAAVVKISPPEASASEILGPSFTEIPADAPKPKPGRWTRVEKIKIENFKAIDSVEIPIGRVTILVGPNGSGKSSALQAIHWSARASSYISRKNGKEMIAFERIDYLPSSEPLRTAFRGELRSEVSTRPTSVTYEYAAIGDQSAHSTTVKIWAARNKGGITAHIDGGSTTTAFKQRHTFITAYIPGLAGLSEREVILAQPSLRRQAASGDAGGVLRNILLNLAVRRANETDESDSIKRIEKLNEYVSEVHPGISIQVSYDDREDFYINATYKSKSLIHDERSLESAATGVLQTIQIFAYLLLFQPKIMLIDEPDAHLHPDKQERLVENLERASSEFETQIILTTHSPHIVRAASPEVTLVWMDEGVIKTDNDDAIRSLMGWGGLDKKLLLFVEDKEDKAVREILKQWPELYRSLSVCRCFGVDNLPKSEFMDGLMVDGKLGIKTIIHRDGDFMTEKERNDWIGKYSKEHTQAWITEGPDIEAYFCRADYLSATYGVSEEVAAEWITDACNKVGKAEKEFESKRKVINRIYTETGGSPSSEQLWKDWGGPSPRTIKGKNIIGQLKNIVKSKGFDSKHLDKYHIPKHFTLAPELKHLIQKALE